MRKKLKVCECRGNPSVYFIKKVKGGKTNLYLQLECDSCGKRMKFHQGGDYYD